MLIHHNKLLHIADQWIAAPFRSKGVNKYGCDCFGLIYGIFREYTLTLDPAIDVQSVTKELYSLFISLTINMNFHDIANIIHKSRLFTLVTRQEASMITGDIIIIQTRQIKYHLLLYIDDKHIIHASNIMGRVCYISLSECIINKIIAIVRLA